MKDSQEQLLKDFEEFVEAVKCSPWSWATGVCCCGSPMEGHSVYDNHSPTDEGEDFIQGYFRKAKACFAKAREEQ